MSQPRKPSANELKIAFLGPRGTFSEEIALGFYRGVEGRFIPYASIDAVIRAVADGEVSECVVPVENSLDGSVNITLDTLAHEVDLYIVKEIIRPVSHNLLTRDDTKHVNVILSHPQAFAQCRRYLRQSHPGAELVTVDSTAAAAYQVASGAKNHAAIGSARAAQLYGLKIAAADIEDSPHNSTRFIVLGRQPVTGSGKACKTSIVCQINGEKPGSLCDILTEFASRQVNLTKIESRPARTGLGYYIFFLDAEGSLEEENVRAAVEAVQHKSLWFKSLGSYPVSAAQP